MPCPSGHRLAYREEEKIFTEEAHHPSTLRMMLLGKRHPCEGMLRQSHTLTDGPGARIILVPILNPVSEVVPALDGFGAGAEGRVAVVPSDDGGFVYWKFRRVQVKVEVGLMISNRSDFEGRRYR